MEGEVLFHVDGQTYDKASTHFAQFCEYVYTHTHMHTHTHTKSGNKHKLSSCAPVFPH